MTTHSSVLSCMGRCPWTEEPGGHGWVTERLPSWWLPPSLPGNTYRWGIVPWSELMARLLIRLFAPVWGNLESFRKTDGSISDANAIFKSSCVCDKKNKPEFRAVPGLWAQPPVGPRSHPAFPRLINSQTLRPCYPLSLVWLLNGKIIANLVLRGPWK